MREVSVECEINSWDVPVSDSCSFPFQPEQARGAKCLVQMEGNQTVLHPPDQEDKATKDKERDRKEHAFSFGESCCP
jgi:hypothetical protein